MRGGYPKNTVIIDMTVMQGVRVTVAAVGRGYPKTAVTTVTAVTLPPCKGNLPAVFPAAVLVADTVLT